MKTEDGTDDHAILSVRIVGQHDRLLKALCGLVLAYIKYKLQLDTPNALFKNLKESIMRMEHALYGRSVNQFDD